MPRGSPGERTPRTPPCGLPRGLQFENLDLRVGVALFFFSLFISSLELRDTKVYEPSTRARLGTAAYFCKALDLEFGWNVAYLDGELLVLILRLLQLDRQCVRLQLSLEVAAVGGGGVQCLGG